MNEETCQGILKRHLYPAICFIPKSILSLRRVNGPNLRKMKETVTTFHCHRFTYFLITKLFDENLKQDRLLTNLYRDKAMVTERVHLFYLVLFLCVMYFKRTDYNVGRRIIELLLKLKRIAKDKEPFHDLYVSFVKNKTRCLLINNHTQLNTLDFVFTSPCEVRSEFRSLEKMISNYSTTEWLADTRVFHDAKSLCNFAYRYRTSNVVIQDTSTKMLTSELYYPKPWFDFAYNFKQRLVLGADSRRHCFHILKTLLIDPIPTRNLSFCQYVMNIVSFFANFLSNKVLRLNKAGCFCHTKCIRTTSSLEKLYMNSMMILCKTCNMPTNYEHKIYNKVHVWNDIHNHNVYLSCQDSCTQFDIVDLYELCLDKDGNFQYQYQALSRTVNKVQNLTSICNKSRTCFNVVTTENKAGGDIRIYCSNNHNLDSETCYDMFQSEMLHGDQINIDEDWVLKHLCIGCIAHCYDFCTWNNRLKRFVRNVIG